jgi:hypothetical protein
MEGTALTAYKFVRPGAIGPFSRRVWTPGEWRDGIYASEPRHLPLWIWEELWEVELAGEVTVRGHKLHAPRGRLVRRVEPWAQPTARRFAQDCARSAAQHAAEPLRAAGQAEAAAVFADGRDMLAVRDLTRELWSDLPPDVQRPVGMASDGARRALAATDSGDAYVVAQGGAVAAYIAAMTAARVGGQSAHDAERSRQAGWLADALALI